MQMKIRKYKPSDKKQIENLHFEVGFLGKSMSNLLSRSNLWNENIQYYLEEEPESIFVLDNNGKILGYVIGCLNDKYHKKNIKLTWSTLKNFFASINAPKRDKHFWWGRFLVIFKAIFGLSDELKFKSPKNAGHFHISLLPEARGNNFGSMLFKKFEDYAKANGVKIIHADGFEAKVNPNVNFWFKNGFKVYSKVKTSIWEKQLPDENINLVCYYKEL